MKSIKGYFLQILSFDQELIPKYRPMTPHYYLPYDKLIPKI
jgi:hypothetical protein